jgi:hypothetical protein
MGMVSEETQRMGERVTYYQVNNAIFFVLKITLVC